MFMQDEIPKEEKEQALEKAKELEEEEKDEPFPDKKSLEEDNDEFKEDAKDTKKLMDELEDIEK